MPQVTHGWSVDVEDWFHILDCAGAPDVASWDSQPARVALGTRRILDLCDAYHVRGTFFCLGWIARKHPELIAEIAARGHDVGSHGDQHLLVHTLTPETFARDLDASLQAIQHATGKDVQAFRAPGFSITPSQTWALPILASRGITLDASLFLAAHGHGGFPLQRSRPFELHLPDGRKLLEVPVIPWRVAGRDLPFAGGGYLRLLPGAALEHLFADFDARGLPVTAYLHPRELDPQQPRMDLPLRRRFKYYVGLHTVEAKLRRLFGRFRFAPLAEVAAQGLDAPVAV